MFANFFQSFIPKVSAQEEELVDPQQELREKCSAEPAAANLLAQYQECNDRVNAKTKTTETCAQELYDFIHVLDGCVTKSLFKKLK
ncbi:unnamed protein product [Diamesa hyperborea]